MYSLLTKLQWSSYKKLIFSERSGKKAKKGLFLVYCSIQDPQWYLFSSGTADIGLQQQSSNNPTWCSSINKYNKDLWIYSFHDSLPEKTLLEIIQDEVQQPPLYIHQHLQGGNQAQTPFLYCGISLPEETTKYPHSHMDLFPDHRSLNNTLKILWRKTSELLMINNFCETLYIYITQFHAELTTKGFNSLQCSMVYHPSSALCLHQQLSELLSGLPPSALLLQFGEAWSGWWGSKLMLIDPPYHAALMPNSSGTLERAINGHTVNVLAQLVYALFWCTTVVKETE